MMIPGHSPAHSALPHCLIVDDDGEIRELLKTFLADQAKITLASNGSEALAKMNSRWFDVIISDVDMPVLNGPNLFKTIYDKDPTISSRFIFCTGSRTPELDQICSRHNVDIISKPIQFRHMQNILQTMFE